MAPCETDRFQRMLSRRSALGNPGPAPGNTISSFQRKMEVCVTREKKSLRPGETERLYKREGKGGNKKNGTTQERNGTKKDWGRK